MSAEVRMMERVVKRGVLHQRKLDGPRTLAASVLLATTSPATATVIRWLLLQLMYLPNHQVINIRA
ncbi:mannan endo-1,4-beta-mannosidase 1 [Iris pallida]|uniref:Mannan endo-1,4-beta-mannosidase 1 n=1 Tax=Iris pallida TaxID=29817 RepID=A0AAX6GFR7_IRIPA|nr:mannan endo-1,4-beta-mannosidase 1 [Iris pallida]